MDSRGAILVCGLLLCDPLLRRGWQHDGRSPVNPEHPGLKPQKIPS
jgi:hypothetical protein